MSSTGGPAIELRAARPEAGEGAAYARYLDTAAEGFFRFMLGPRVNEIIAAAFVQPDHDLSFQHATFAEREGQIVGMISGFTAEQHRGYSDEPFLRAAGKSRLRMTIVGVMIKPVMRVMDTMAEGDFYLQAVAVDDAARGEGLGSRLLDFIEQRAREEGTGRLVLDASARNASAVRFYEHRGMTVESRWPKRVRIPGLKLLRMVKELE